MTRPAEQVPVPTNGKGPGQAPGSGQDDAPNLESTPARPAPPTPTGRATIDVTPAQLAVGFGIIASVVLLLARSLRRRRSGR